MRRTAAVALTLSLATTAVTAGALTMGASAAPGTSSAGPRDVMFVGNNWDGTATVVDARTHKVVRTLNMVPDKAERMTDILTHPDKLAFCLSVQQGGAEGHNQCCNDIFPNHARRMLAVSRP